MSHPIDVDWDMKYLWMVVLGVVLIMNLRCLIHINPWYLEDKNMNKHLLIDSGEEK